MRYTVGDVVRAVKGLTETYADGRVVCVARRGELGRVLFCEDGVPLVRWPCGLAIDCDDGDVALLSAVRVSQ